MDVEELSPCRTQLYSTPWLVAVRGLQRINMSRQIRSGHSPRVSPVADLILLEVRLNSSDSP